MEKYEINKKELEKLGDMDQTIFIQQQKKYNDYAEIFESENFKQNCKKAYSTSEFFSAENKIQKLIVNYAKFS